MLFMRQRERRAVGRQVHAHRRLPPTRRAPTVAVTAPAAGATVSNTVSVTANASDNTGVVGVQFKLDGANLGIEDSSAPYSVSWDTTADRERLAHAHRGRARRGGQHDHVHCRRPSP